MLISPSKVLLSCGYELGSGHNVWPLCPDRSISKTYASNMSYFNRLYTVKFHHMALFSFFFFIITFNWVCRLFGCQAVFDTQVLRFQTLWLVSCLAVVSKKIRGDKLSIWLNASNYVCCSNSAALGGRHLRLHVLWKSLHKVPLHTHAMSIIFCARTLSMRRVR